MIKLSFRIIALLLAITTNGIASAQTTLDYQSINSQVQQEYLRTVHPGIPGERPFWNTYAKGFVYAPSFDFKTFKKAAKYMFTVDGNESFYAEEPNSSLAPLWNKIASGEHKLKVTALDKKNKEIGVSGERTFIKRDGFCGPYNRSARSYGEAALKALIGIYNSHFAQYFLDHQEPLINQDNKINSDAIWYNGCYLDKITGSTISAMAMLVKCMPEYKEKATKIARNAAQLLIKESRPVGTPLAYFPPTYYGDQLAAGNPDNKDKCMMMEPTTAGLAFLDLFDITGDSLYMKHAVGIADTYLRVQNEDGSYPVKVDFITGKPVNSAKVGVMELVRFYDRLHEQYHFTKYDASCRKALDWMNVNRIKNFNWTGQFEDVSVDVSEYQNLTAWPATPYASYLLTKDNATEKDVSDAEDIIRFAEDQFTIWRMSKPENGVPQYGTPCVMEQYNFFMPVDDSTAQLAEAFIDYYAKTGDKPSLAKGLALLNNLTIWQHADTGIIPSVWFYGRDINELWINDMVLDIQILFRVDKYLKEHLPQMIY
jgi:hypothetical protein